MRTLEEMEANAQRQLDGMTANRDQLAMDLLQLTRAVRAAQGRAKTRDGLRTGPAPGGYSEAFSDLFGRIFPGS